MTKLIKTKKPLLDSLYTPQVSGFYSGVRDQKINLDGEEGGLLHHIYLQWCFFYFF